MSNKSFEGLDVGGGLQVCDVPTRVMVGCLLSREGAQTLRGWACCGWQVMEYLSCTPFPYLREMSSCGWIYDLGVQSRGLGGR